MAPSIAGILVCFVLFLIGFYLRAPLIVGLFAALPFGSTAIVALPALGGSSPLAFIVFVLALLTSVIVRRGFIEDLEFVFKHNPIAWVVSFLMAYAIVTAILLPRLFAGETNAFVVEEGTVVEVQLEPGSGNITQPAYFAVGSLTFLVFCVLFLRNETFQKVRLGYFAWVWMHAALGLIDIGAKLVGAGDILWPIRSASYALLVDVVEEGFYRIAGGYAEASSFGGATLACLAFTFTYWRDARARWALALSIILLLLLVFSTSSTAYAGIAIVLAIYAASTALSVLRGQLRSTEVQLLALAWITLTIVLCVYLYNEGLFEPFLNMINTMVFEKSASASADERAHWNAGSLQAFLDTFGLGIGFGSSRASSWAIAVLSQLGLIGALLFAILIADLLRGFPSASMPAADREIIAVGEGARAATIAWLVAASISFGSADPGIIFFIGLATTMYCRSQALRTPDLPIRPAVVALK